MDILPAIDIKDGKCVRLYQGDYQTAYQVAEDPLDTAKAFEKVGAEWLHMVDLDGAKDGSPINRDLFLKIAKETSLKLELGGGIRSLETIKEYLEQGVYRVILGSVALKRPDLVAEAVALYGDRIVVGIDAKDGYARGEGWLSGSEHHYLDLAEAMAKVGVKVIVYTDIAKDGTMTGPSIEHYEALLKRVPNVEIIASGGIRDLADVERLKRIGCHGAICGKSIYDGALDLEEALKMVKEA